MLGQLDVWGKDKVENAIQRLQTFCPPEGYFVAFSGGKDSQCVYELCKMAGVPFDAHYHVTSVDPPELIRFIKAQYPDVEFDYPKYEDGKRITMWSLIAERQMPPTRISRYCCEKLKEPGGGGRLVVTGVRWDESSNRSANQGMVTMPQKSKKTVKMLKEMNVDFTKTNKGGVVLNLDNDESRRAVEMCYRTRKTLVNPIIDWDESEVWEFLNEVVKVPHCCLYDEGFKRLGCIGCPMQGSEGMKRDFERWPKYKDAYIRAFKKMLENGAAFRAIADENGGGGADNGERAEGLRVVDETVMARAKKVFDWWVGDIERY